MEPQEFERGRIDHSRGLPITANPYVWGGKEQNAWARGWKTADHTEKEAKRKAWNEAHPQPERTDDGEIPF
jgi:hypothetical protein